MWKRLNFFTAYKRLIYPIPNFLYLSHKKAFIHSQIDIIMQTILGAGGAIGTELAKALTPYTQKIRLVSRTPRKVNPFDETFPADLANLRQVEKAVEGSKVVYLVAGVEYKTKVWEQKWPLIMHNVIRACKMHNARLVFFDNIYMYHRNHLHHMTEETPIHPTSKKGAVRAYIAQMLLEEMEEGELTALIARAADFIGPKNSALVETVCNNLKKGSKAMWFADADKIHTFTYTADAAKATALLGNTPDSFNQVWHLPTDHSPLTGKDWVKLFADELNVEPKIQVLPVWAVGALGLFIPVLKELKEMLYQYDRDYLFDSSKFEERFSYKPVSPEEAVKQTVAALENAKNEMVRK